MNFFPVFKGMKNSSDKRMSRAAFVGLSICTTAYIIVGLLGYHLASPKVDANFLRDIQYDKDDTLKVIIFFVINIGFIVSIFFAFSIIFFGCRNNFIALVKLFLTPAKVQLKSAKQSYDNIEEITSFLQT